MKDEETLAESGFYWRERGGVKVLVCKPLEEAGFANGFSTRVGGVSPFPLNDLNLAGFDEDSAENIYENRRRFLSVFNGEFHLASAWQVHGNAVKIVVTDSDAANSDEKCDALVSDRIRTLVGVKTADCVPVLLGDPVTNSYAAVHSGWKGTAAAIVDRAVKALKRAYEAKPENMIAAIGPCASGKNYEVGQDVIDAFQNSFEDHERYFAPTRPGHALVDLKQANKDLLLASGIAVSNIYISSFCTIECADLFFSYRVEKKTLGKTGRLLSVIGRRSTN